MIAPTPDAFGTLYDNAAPHITLHNGRVFQVLMLVQLTDGNGALLNNPDGSPCMIPYLDANGLPEIDMAATFSAQNAWLAAHPEESLFVALLPVMMALAGGDPAHPAPTE